MLRNQLLLTKICLILSVGTLAFQLMSLDSFPVETQGRSVVIELPRGPVTVVLPITMRYVGIYLDGGTISVSFSDAKSAVYTFYLDGRGRVNPPQKHFYWGGYPDRAGAQKLGIGSKAERAFLAILDEWDKTGRPSEPTKFSYDGLIKQVIDTLRARAISK